MKDWPPRYYELLRDLDDATSKEDAAFEALKGGAGDWAEYEIERDRARLLQAQIAEIVRDPTNLIDV